MPQVNTEPCKECGVVIRYKGDMSRHAQLHKPAATMHKCPYDGCPYESLQKSNLNTHICTHTGEKPNACPDCDYRTADPGCLTRHRRSKHAYVPKSSKAKASSASKQARRHSPYKRTNFTPTSSSSTCESLPSDNPSIVTPTSPHLDVPEVFCDEFSSNLFSYTWDKTLSPLDMASAPWSMDSSPAFTSVPYFLETAVNTCSQLYSSVDRSFDVMDIFSHDTEYSQTICPPDTYLAKPEAIFYDASSWAFDIGMVPAAPIAIATEAYLEWTCDFAPFYPSPSLSPSSMGSYFSDCSSSPFTFSSSPSPSPEDITFANLLSSSSLADFLPVSV
ncbi:hypothetical protein DXG01_003820 [Tephrocybe rancida]|nr:hypothetical protein DXG01_003820 [Tephrocybe rancida]